MRWPDFGVLDPLVEQFTVLLASPCGYQLSSRLPPNERYSADLLILDLLASAEHAGAERFHAFGYSLTAAMVALLACETHRVIAVVAGGFPLLGSYARVLARATQDAAATDVPFDDFDARAAIDFYGDLADLDDGTLIRDAHCPILAFWGTDDALLQSFNSAPDFAGDLSTEGVTTMPIPGYGHDDAIFGLSTADLASWLRASVQ
ncbi:MAG TPA: hypothetical protein VFC99_19420 [Acidimicrobiia bacterium]|nr:hypothetical protein [Acidimicrobiia bacterium]